MTKDQYYVDLLSTMKENHVLQGKKCMLAWIYARNITDVQLRRQCCEYLSSMNCQDAE